MSYKTDLKASITIQDDTLPAPGLKAQNQAVDLLEDVDEILVLRLTVKAGATDQTVALTTPGLSARVLYITTTQALTMKQGASSDVQPIRSMFVGTYESSNAPASVKFSNAGDDDAAVKIILGSLN